jgi:hypothetical protein
MRDIDVKPVRFQTGRNRSYAAGFSVYADAEGLLMLKDWCSGK